MICPTNSFVNSLGIKCKKGFLPDEIITKSKHGIGLPVTSWFKKDSKMKELLYDTVFTGTPKISLYLKQEFTDQMKNSFENDSSSYYGDNLWVFLILEQRLNNV